MTDSRGQGRLGAKTIVQIHLSFLPQRNPSQRVRGAVRVPIAGSVYTCLSKTTTVKATNILVNVCLPWDLLSCTVRSCFVLNEVLPSRTSNTRSYHFPSSGNSHSEQQTVAICWILAVDAAFHPSLFSVLQNFLRLVAVSWAVMSRWCDAVTSSDERINMPR